MAWLSTIAKIFSVIMKLLFGTDKPQKTTVVKPKPEIEVDDGKTDEERLNDLGL